MDGVVGVEGAEMAFYSLLQVLITKMDLETALKIGRPPMQQIFINFHCLRLVEPQFTFDFLFIALSSVAVGT